MPNIIPDPSDNSFYGFSARDSERVATSVKRVESEFYNDRPYRQHGPKIGGSCTTLTPAQLTTSLAAGTLAVPTSAGATRLIVAGSGPGFTTVGGSPIVVYNTFAAAVSSGKFIWAVFVFNNWYLVQADC